MKNKVLEFINEFIKKLKTAADFTAEDFRLVADYTESLSLGQKENELLGPYNMPSISKDLSASLYVIWKDKRISNVNLNYETINNFESEIANWKKNSYKDEFAPSVWREEEFDNDDVLTYKMRDEKIEKIVAGDAAPLFEAINLINSELKPYSKLLSAGGGASVTRRLIYVGAEAENPNYDFTFTMCAVYFNLDNTYSDSYFKRRIFNTADLNKLINKAKQFYPHFSKKAEIETVNKNQAAGLDNIILTPDVADSFIKKYVMPNIYGSSVVERQSKFSIDEFRSQEKVFRDDISFKFCYDSDEYDINNIPVSYEGVYGKPVYFIKNGKLQTPVLDLKYSKKAEMPPTAYLDSRTFQSGEYSLKIETNEYEEMENIISDLSNGYIVFTVLGMHTQDHTSGNFSLSSPYALKISDGKIEGLCKISISGNFFDILNHSNTKFLNWYSEGDTMAFKCHCS
ncbi:MAG: metallopeptidase TldD-related protein [Candidatus Wallbacteria bacterium]